jgi:hypothetical protein
MSAEPKSAGSKITINRVISLASLVLASTALLLALRKPQPVSVPQAPAVVASNAQSFQTKVDQLAQAQAQGQTGSEVHLSSGEISAALEQASGGPSATPAPAATTNTTPTNTSTTAAAPDLSAQLAAGSIDMSNMPEPIVSFEGDQMKGQFVTEIAGKKVYVTIAGHLGAKDGYASFEPTEFKIGDLNVPVSLVNDALQKKMLEQRDRLKLPDYVSDIHVENGELVVKQK